MLFDPADFALTKGNVRNINFADTQPHGDSKHTISTLVNNTTSISYVCL